MLRRLVTTLAAFATGGILVGAASPSYAAEGWDIPQRATITVDGHGYGHGTGMSQYGAERAATEGVGYRGILGYYYPGTSWGEAAGAVRVWISSDLTNDVQVAARKGLVARKSGTSKTWKLSAARARATRWRIVPAGDRASVLEYRTAGWHRFRKVAGLLEFAAGGRPIRLYVHGGSVEYRGTLRSVPSSPGNRITVNVLPMEAYLRGVVPAETFASSWHQQALRAQAVAARTYAAHERADRVGHPYDLCDTAACQAYGGASAEYPTSDRAVRGTARRILTYDAKPAYTQFTASSGGYTTESADCPVAECPYLQAMPDQWETAKDPNRDWRVRFTDRELERTWPELGDLRRIEIDGRDGHGEWGGRAGTVTLTGTATNADTTAPTKVLTGAEFAAALHLRSAWLSLTVAPR